MEKNIQTYSRSTSDIVTISFLKIMKFPFKVRIFNYYIIKELPFKDLTLFKDHRRLRVFNTKGCKCTNPECNRVGTRLAIGIAADGAEHIDIYTDDWYPMTIDHHKPKAVGGTDHIDNLNPMCAGCNSNKGSIWEGVNYGKKQSKQPQNVTNKLSQVGRVGINEDTPIGTVLFKKVKKKCYLLGRLSKHVHNPHINKPAVMIEGNDTSMYSYKQVLKRKDDDEKDN